MNTATTNTDAEPTGAATYCPEDNKLRLYVGRVPREEYLKLRAEGWTALHKQRETGGGDFAAIWSVERRDTALEYAGIIEDEDKGPAERAVERAERFAIYREKRTAEATGHADRFDAGPKAHGYQSEARAERAARRHDAVAGRAVDAWSKAEYWQSRTAGVISHALHVAAPGVRVGRIKDIEANQRKMQSLRDQTEKALAAWSKPGLTLEEAVKLSDNCGLYLPRKEGDRPDFNGRCSSYDALTNRYPNLYAPRTFAEVLAHVLEVYPRNLQRADDWLTHYALRLAYENQMIEAQGGRAAFVEMEAGGWIGNRQIRKVNKSNKTGRVVSVTLKIAGDRWGNTREGFHLQAFNIERLPADAYRAPTAEDLASLKETKSAEKSAAPRVVCPLINPTDKDAARLQALWNERTKAKGDARRARDKYAYCPELENEVSAVVRMTQAAYSQVSGGTYARAETLGIEAGGNPVKGYRAREKEGAPVCKVRATSGANYMADRVIIITDKPQKPLPAAVWKVIAEAVEA